MKKNLSILPATKADLKILQVDTQLQELNEKMDRVLDKLGKVRI